MESADYRTAGVQTALSRLISDAICVDFPIVFSGFDHGVGHPLLLLCNAKAPNYRKNKAFKILGPYAEWPKVADAVIEAEILLLSHPKRHGGWEVINGALEAGETVVEGALRETTEEAGAAVRVRPLGTVHVSTFHYDQHAQYMLSISYLMAYQGGEVQLGDDMQGSQYRWWTLDDLAEAQVQVLIPPHGKWLLQRAVELYRLWKGQEVEIQAALTLTAPKPE